LADQLGGDRSHAGGPHAKGVDEREQLIECRIVGGEQRRTRKQRDDGLPAGGSGRVGPDEARGCADDLPKRRCRMRGGNTDHLRAQDGGEGKGRRLNEELEQQLM
jgi:hypothetical protein